jgi:hypothetical protein
MRKLLFTCFCLITVLLSAQDNYEIQVYGSQTQAPHSTIFELHSNYTFLGEKNIIKGVRPSNHALHETVEITTGITDNFELGFYLFTNYTSGYGYKVIGTHIRPRIMAPLAWHLPVGLSLSVEAGFQSTYYSPDSWNVEIRPIIDKQWDKLYVAFNPTLGISLKGVDNDSRPVFEPNIKTAYALFKKATLGFEYYGSLGTVTEFERPADQSHALFLAYDMVGNPDWELNIGPGWGLTKATDGFVFKILVGRRVQWHTKHKTAS